MVFKYFCMLQDQISISVYNQRLINAFIEVDCIVYNAFNINHPPNQPHISSTLNYMVILFSRIGSIFLLALLIASCVDPLDVTIDEEVNVLIVEGAITTGPGPHKVRLSRSARYGLGNFGGSVLPVSGASVVIRDSEGNNYSLTEETFIFPKPRPPAIGDAGKEVHLTGVYAVPNNFSAVVGNTYTLLITTKEGIEYTSLPEKIIPVTEILGLNAEFSKVAIGSNEYKTGFNVYATFEDPLEEQNFYMWKNTGLYYIRAFPSLRICQPHPLVGGPAFPCPADCCEHCWISETRADQSLLILSDNNINGNKTSIFTTFIEDDRVRFRDKYMVRIELHALNREAFQYFSLLQNQLSINGDIFDPPPATLRGNMINLANPDENVLGYFRASAVSIDSMFLTREMLLEPKLLLPLNLDCRDYRYGLAITQEPDFW